MTSGDEVVDYEPGAEQMIMDHSVERGGGPVQSDDDGKDRGGEDQPVNLPVEQRLDAAFLPLGGAGPNKSTA